MGGAVAVWGWWGGVGCINVHIDVCMLRLLRLQGLGGWCEEGLERPYGIS